MCNNLKSYLILGLAINALMFSSSTQAAIRWGSFDLKMNEIGVGVDGGKNKRLFVSLGSGFSTPKPYDAVLKYNRSNTHTFEVGGIKVKNGTTYHFDAIKYGATAPISVYDKTGKVDTYTLVFTNLPVIQITSVATIQDINKVQGSFRLMSGEFKQDTGEIAMGIEYRGKTAQNYPKLPFGISLGTSPTLWKKSNDIKLLDLSKRSDWILDASYRDTSFSRNIVNYDIFRTIYPHNKGLPKGQTAIKGRLTEVILGANYAGVYLLEEKIDRSLLDLKKITVPKVNGKEDWKKVDFKLSANSSVLYKSAFGDQVFFNTTPTLLKTNFSQEYPKLANVARWEPLKGIIDFVAKSDDDTFIENIEKRIDFDSVANWWLLVAATQATDNYNKNFFLAKNAGGKFFIVPWDHDATFGLWWNGAADPANTLVDAPDNNLIKRLTQFPEIGFNEKLKVRWTELSGKNGAFDKAKLLARFNSYGSQLTQGGAKERNLLLWPKSVLPPAVANPQAGTSAYIGAFLDKRFSAMDAYIKSLPE